MIILACTFSFSLLFLVLHSTKPTQTRISPTIPAGVIVSPITNTPSTVANTTRDKSMMPYKLTGICLIALNDNIHAVKITSDFNAMNIIIFHSTPPALGTVGRMNTNERSVYNINTSSTVFFSSDFFFTISLPPLSKP